MKRSPTKSNLQRAIEHEKDPPREVVVAKAVKGCVVVPLIFSCLAFLALIGTVVAMFQYGWDIASHVWTYALPTVIVIVVILVLSVAWLLSAWILKNAGVE